MKRRILTMGAVCMIVLGCSSEQNAGNSTTTPAAQSLPQKPMMAPSPRETAAPGAVPHEEAAVADMPAETPIPENGTAAQALELGPSEPAVLTAAALERAARLLQESGADSELFRRELQSIAKNLPAVSVNTDAAGVIWNRMVMHGAGRRIEAVRFTSPLQEPADLVWMFVTPGLVPTWNILPVEGSLPALGSKREQNLHLPGCDFPKRNVAFIQSLRGGHVQPGGDYILWFAAEKPKAVEYQMAFRLVPANTMKARFTAKAMARDLGLDWPTEPTPAVTRILDGLEDGVAQLRIAPDGLQIVGAGTNGTICIWDISDGKRTAAFQTGTDALQSMELSPNGKTLATSPAMPAEISLWDIPSRAPLGTLPGRDTRCGAIAFSPDGEHLAAWYGAGPNEDEVAGEITWWDVRSRQPAATFPTQTLRGYALQVTPDGTALFAAGVHVSEESPGVRRFDGSQLNHWSITTGDRTTFFGERFHALRHIRISADGARIALGTWRGLVRLLDGQPLGAVASVQQDARLNALAWSPDESLLAFGGNDGTLRVWDVIRRTWRSVFKADWRSVASVAFSPDGHWLASGGWDGSVRLWDVSRLGTTPEELLTQGIWDKPAFTDSIGMRLVPIPAGKSLRGAPDEDDHPPGWPAPERRDNQRPQREITITKPFYLAAQEVTVAQFRKFVEATGYQTEAEASRRGGKCFDDRLRRFVQKTELTWRTPGFEQTDEHPVVHMTWNDAQAFCKWMSTTEQAIYRLPTEAEWEHACRAGSRASGWTFGNDGGGFAESVNVADMLLRREYPHLQLGGNWRDGYAFTAPAGSYEPNAFGLYDMHGNVWEWCQDWFDAHYYAIRGTTDPQGSTAGKMRVQRGGSFFSHPYDATYASRGFDEPDSAVDNTGFRPVREIP